MSDDHDDLGKMSICGYKFDITSINLEREYIVIRGRTPGPVEECGGDIFVYGPDRSLVMTGHGTRLPAAGKNSLLEFACRIKFDIPIEVV
jgi:hypothetical protein